MNKYFLIQPTKLIKKFYSKAVWQIATSEKEIYLTFDDGPVAGLTEWILDELKKYNAKATFFCVGENILKHKIIFDRVVNEGHQVGNHTQNHIKGFNSNLAEYLANTENCEKLTASKLFRPPYGQLRKSQYKALLSRQFTIVFWDIISYDYENISKEDCFANIKKNIKNGSIVLFHDNLKAEENVKFALTETLRYYSDSGFVFKAIPPSLCFQASSF